MVKKIGLGLLNPMRSEKENELSSQWESAEIIWAVTGVGAFSNADHLLALMEERRDRQENQDVANNATLHDLVGDLLGTNWNLILWAKNTGSWMSVLSTTLSGTVFLATEFCDLLCTSYNVTPFNLHSHCDICGNRLRGMLRITLHQRRPGHCVSQQSARWTTLPCLAGLHLSISMRRTPNTSEPYRNKEGYTSGE